MKNIDYYFDNSDIYEAYIECCLIFLCCDGDDGGDDDDEDHQGVGEGDAEGRDGDQEEGGDPNHLDRHPLHRVRAEKLLLEFQHPREKCVGTCLSQRK